MSDHGQTPPTAADEIVLTRLFNAPRSLVFEAWTDPRHLLRWWAPAGCTAAHCTVDLRPGGAFHFCMRLDDGREIWGLGIYREIIAPEKIVYVDSFSDASGRKVEPGYYGMSADHPSETLVTVTFAEDQGRTRVTLMHSFPESVRERADTEKGWGEMLDSLAAHLAENGQASVRQ
jgi:uncharacterized protein YndB with AHSA1/START domain